MMKTNHLPKADFLDIVFEHRNKAYGAYVLRRAYPQHVFRGLAGTAAFSLCFMLAVYFGKNPRADLRRAVDLPAVPVVLEVLPVDLPPLSPDPMPRAAQARSSVQDLVPRIVPDTEPVETPVPTVDMLAAVDPGYETREGSPDAPLTGTGSGPAPVAAEPPVPEVPEVFMSHAVDVPAQFPGGPAALRRFLERNLRTPETEPSPGSAPVRVQVMFTVAVDGRPGRYEMVHSGGPAFDAEVIRVLDRMPRWTPARRNGRDVAMYFILPVLFDSPEPE